MTLYALVFAAGAVSGRFAPPLAAKAYGAVKAFVVSKFPSLGA